ncbi:MAG: NADH:ubiquinone reductase (Na(+)-transporting) subunit C [Candidatus Marinimicrobia bacterium]|nr:NADH:ubiquinone reductase (Na(+)-transporting) subunit C [Candidatus Neomarinimicrobiota bacterium]|tara:strand:+ start:27356 stop:28060 length:705 start_codon:yes stop_codon:yes gene_type:complete
MKNKYIFILSITFVSSLLLSLFSEGLKEKTLFNIQLDKKKNLLQTIGVNTDILTTDEILKEFNDNIKEITLDLNGNVLSGVNHNQFITKENNATGELKYYVDENEYLPVFLSETMNAIIVPISGKGLWSSLYGYFAIDKNNFSTVKGITFYKHGETPGLGAEITKEWFKSSFIGKEVYLDDSIESIKVTKAGQANKNSLYEVNGISGATITSRGVEDLLKRDLLRYENYFRKNK